MLSYTEGNHRVLECIFSDLTNHAILFNISNNDNKLLTDFCLFSNVSCEAENGGAIYLVDKGNMCINRVCAINCHCGDKQGHFSNYLTKGDINRTSILNYSSIYNCGLENRGLDACTLGPGNTKLKQTNFSECKGICSGFLFEGDENSFVEYSTFENMNASDPILVFGLCQKGVAMRNCNIMRNSGKKLIHAELLEEIMIRECAFTQNKADSIFFAVFAKMTIFHCYLNENTFATTVNGTVYFSFNTSYISTPDLEFALELINWSSCEAIKIYISNKVDHGYTPLFIAALSALIFNRLK